MASELGGMIYCIYTSTTKVIVLPKRERKREKKREKERKREKKKERERKKKERVCVYVIVFVVGCVRERHS
jgi:hypothetical protein